MGDGTRNSSCDTSNPIIPLSPLCLLSHYFGGENGNVANTITNFTRKMKTVININLEILT